MWVMPAPVGYVYRKGMDVGKAMSYELRAASLKAERHFIWRFARSFAMKHL